MMLFTWKNGTLQCAANGTTIALFPAQAQDGGISLLCAPEETPSKGAVSWPGEYDMSGIAIRGIGHREGQGVSYVCIADGVRIACPCSTEEIWEESDIEKLGNVQVLVLSGDTPKGVQWLLDELDPRVLVLTPRNGPLHPDVLKMCGAVGKEVIAEYKLKGSLPAEGREVVLLG